MAGHLQGKKKGLHGKKKQKQKDVLQGNSKLNSFTTVER